MRLFLKRIRVVCPRWHGRAPRTICLSFFLGLAAWSPNQTLAGSSNTETNAAQIATVKARRNAAIQRVEQIVNQPVTELRREPGMHVVTYTGWFHPGAFKPDFRTVDIRQTQEFPYSKYQYVTSDLNPGVVFLGSELEFNSMTKYFYLNRSWPKKRLTEAEMLEINQLYRVIGKCEHQLFDLEHPIDRQSLQASKSSNQAPTPQPLLATIHRWIFTHKPAAAGTVAVLLVLLIGIRALRPRAED